ncbi:MAG: phytoene/squalene synthase family protein [Trueperaceae bacterium]
MTIDEAINYCTRLTKDHSSTFYLGSRLFAPPERKAVSVVYAVCRSGDDAVDEAPNYNLAFDNLRLWWENVDRAYSGQPRTTHPLELALTWVLENYDVPKQAFEELYLGLDSDLRPVPYETMDDLMLYCRRVAGVVGWLIAPVAGYRGGQETLEYALALGQAMQLTNILRDVGEDFEKGRCYLPKELLEKHSVNVSDLRSGLVHQNYITLLEELANLTRQLYRQGWRGIPRLKGAGKTAVGVAALSYESILTKLRQNNYDNLTKRAHLKTLERIALIPKAVYSVYGGTY